MSSVFKVSLAGVALVAVAGCANMGNPGGDYKNQGYLLDQYGQVVKALGYDSCVRTSDWTPARGIVACGDATAPAPKVAAAPAPAPAPKPRQPRSPIL
jgi:hypothetical protein